MRYRLGALATVGALTAVLITGCWGGDDDTSAPQPGAQPKQWCFADAWIDRASYDYGAWAKTENQTPSDGDVKAAMSYGHRLMNLYQADRQAGKLPDSADDTSLTAWALTLNRLRPQSGAGTDYIAQVHSACR